jgi:hypothetical protein
MRTVARWVSVGVLLTACLCGASEAVGAGGSSASAGEVIPLPVGGAGCSRAAVAAAPRAATISFSVRCSGRRRARTVGFAIWRYPERPTGIVGYGPVRVTGAGGDSRRARCTLERGTISCHTSIRGDFTIAGRIQVRPGTRCRRGVSVVQISPAPCSGKVCAGSPKLTQLARRRPRGCA